MQLPRPLTIELRVWCNTACRGLKITDGRGATLFCTNAADFTYKSCVPWRPCLYVTAYHKNSPLAVTNVYKNIPYYTDCITCNFTLNSGMGATFTLFDRNYHLPVPRATLLFSSR